MLGINFFIGGFLFYFLFLKKDKKKKHKQKKSKGAKNIKSVKIKKAYPKKVGNYNRTWDVI